MVASEPLDASTSAMALSLLDGERRLPGGVLVRTSSAAGLELRWFWRRPQNVLGMAGFAALMGGLVVLGLFVSTPAPFAWWAMIGTGTTASLYFLAVEALNRTRLRVAHGVLDVAHGPFPTQHVRALRVPVGAVTRVLVCPTRVRDMRGWELRVVAGDQQSVVMRVDTEEQARAIQRVLEAHLASVGTAGNAPARGSAEIRGAQSAR